MVPCASFMVRVIKLAHVGLHARDLSTQAEFYNDKWCLERVDEFGVDMYLHADGPAPPRLDPALVELVAGIDTIDAAYGARDVKPGT